MTEGIGISGPSVELAMRPAAERRTGALERALEPMRRVSNLPLSNQVSVQAGQAQITSGVGLAPIAAQTDSDRAALRCALSRYHLRGTIREAQPGAFIAPPTVT